MRIIILNQFFYPDHSATSQLMSSLAEGLVEKGVAVTALAGRGRYNGGEKLPRRDVHNGIRIERAFATGFGKRSVMGRLADYLSFYLGASWRLLRMPSHDVVMSLTTPPLIGLVALLVGRIRGMRVVILVQDVYPDVAVALGTLRAGSVLVRALDWISTQVLKRSDRVIVLSDSMRDRIAGKIGEDRASRVDVIHNWADGAEITPLTEAPNPFVVEHGLGDSFVVLFSGNFGLVNDFSTVLEAARLLRDRSDVVFLFVGDGARSNEILEYKSRHSLENVRLIPYQPRDTLRYSLGAGHALLVTLAEGLAGLSVPSKAYAILAAGRPLLFVGDPRSEIAGMITRYNCGAAVASGDGAGLADVITRWSANRDRVEKLGRVARSLFEERFDRPRAVDQYLATLAECANLSKSPFEPRDCGEAHTKGSA